MMSRIWEKKGGRSVCAAALLTTVLCVITALFADYYYDLNDDVLMKDILAGIQTGTPTGYNIQMLYPVSAFLALLYRLCRALPWYGLFLCACQWGCLFLFLRRVFLLWEKRGLEEDSVLTERERKWIGPVLFVCAGASVFGLLERELVYVQYTVTCAMLAGAAVFLLYTSEDGQTTGQFFRQNLDGILLLLLAFLLRSEMLLLLLPFLAAAGLARWSRDGIRASLRYLLLIGTLLAGMVVCYVSHLAAYGSDEWKEFVRFFNARTEIYDFYDVPPYEGNEAFYESIGMSAEEWALLDNYDFGLDKELDAGKMEQIAAYAGECYYNTHTPKERVRAAVWEYVHRMLPLPGDGNGTYVQDMPWNTAVLLLYAALAAVGVIYRRKAVIPEIFLLLLARTVSWGYVLFRGRVPERISHSLYLAEILVLLAFLCTWHEKRREEMRESAVLREKAIRQEILKKETENRRRRVKLAWILPLALMVFLICNVPFTVERVAEEQRQRQQTNQAYEELKAYCRENAEHYYYVDVRPTVYFSEKMFEKVDNSKRNYDIIGGWACKSPVASREEPVWFITRKDKDTEWLNRLLQVQGEGKQAVLEEEYGSWAVYRITGQMEENGQAMESGSDFSVTEWITWRKI